MAKNRIKYLDTERTGSLIVPTLMSTQILQLQLNHVYQPKEESVSPVLRTYCSVDDNVSFEQTH